MRRIGFYLNTEVWTFQPSCEIDMDTFIRNSTPMFDRSPAVFVSEASEMKHDGNVRTGCRDDSRSAG